MGVDGSYASVGNRAISLAVWPIVIAEPPAMRPCASAPRNSIETWVFSGSKTLLDDDAARVMCGSPRMSEGVEIYTPR